MTIPKTDCDLTFVLRCCDDEESIGHTLSKLVTHLRGLGLRFELLVVDEGSGDNTLAVTALLRKQHPEVETLHATTGRAFVVGADRARGRLVAVADVRQDLAPSLLGYALSRAERGSDVVSVGSRLVLFRRTRLLKAIDSLFTMRRGEPTRFVKRARSLGLGVAEVQPRRPRVVDMLRQVLAAPRAMFASTRI